MEERKEKGSKTAEKADNPNANKVSASSGQGKEKMNNYDKKNLCNTENCSSGAPILNLKTNKVIGIHSGFINKEIKYNIGILLKYPLNELIKTYKIKDIKEIIIIIN